MTTTTVDRGLSVEQIARVAHEANRTYQVVTGEPSPDGPWGTHPRQESQIASVRMVLDGATAEEQHADWLLNRTAQGWTYGPVKDEAAKTHPAMVPYSELPEWEKRKDVLYAAIVHALAN